MSDPLSVVLVSVVGWCIRNYDDVCCKEQLDL